MPNGAALFSLRPEHLRLAGAAISPSSVRVRGTLLHQAFHGATELIRIQCSDGLGLVARTPGGSNLPNDLELEFSPADAVPVRESPERN